MSGRRRIQDKWTNLPSAMARYSARREAGGWCLSGRKGCLRIRIEGRKWCQACADKSREYYREKVLLRNQAGEPKQQRRGKAPVADTG